MAFIPLAARSASRAGLMVRSGGHPSSTVRIFQAELLRDPDSDRGRPDRRLDTDRRPAQISRLGGASVR